MEDQAHFGAPGPLHPWRGKIGQVRNFGSGGMGVSSGDDEKIGVTLYSWRKRKNKLL